VEDRRRAGNFQQQAGVFGFSRSPEVGVLLGILGEKLCGMELRTGSEGGSEGFFPQDTNRCQGTGRCLPSLRQRAEMLLDAFEGDGTNPWHLGPG
jgi:hypothetical protein